MLSVGCACYDAIVLIVVRAVLLTTLQYNRFFCILVEEPFSLLSSLDAFESSFAYYFVAQYVGSVNGKGKFCCFLGISC